jgi:hypothetical protein
MSLLAVSQIDELASLVYECVPAGAVMVDNLREMLLEAVEAKNRAKYTGNAYAGTFVLPTSDMLNLVKVQLPFMPECVKYVGCKSIKYAGGLFVPCGGKIKSNSNFCNTCSKKADEKGCHEFGTLDERKDAFDEDENKPYSAGGKTEISYGDYLVAKKITAEEVKTALRSCGLSIKIPTRCLAVTGSAKKRSGRPSKKAEAAAAEEDGSDSEIQAPKPKTPKVKLTVEEKIAKLKAEEELKKQKADQRAAEKLVRDAKKAELEKAKAEAKAEKEAAKAAKKAEEEANGGKKKKATEKKVQAALAALEDSDDESVKAPEKDENNEKTSDEEGETSEIDEPEEEEEVEEEKFTVVKFKGVLLQKGEKSGKMYADSDKKRRFLIAEWNTTQNSPNFVGFNNDACRSILEEVFTNMMENKNPKNRVIIGGKVHEIDYETGHIKQKGKIIKVFLDGSIQDPEDEDNSDDDDN